MSPATMPWLDPVAPWTLPPDPASCAALAVSPSDVPVLDLPPVADDALAIAARRTNRFVPLAGEGPVRLAAVRALATVAAAFGPHADASAPARALALLFHPATGVRPLRALALAARSGGVELAWAQAVLASVLVLGPDESLRERVARELTGVHELSTDVSLALGAGGALGGFRQHYTLLMASPAAHTPHVRAARAFFDYVLARRFTGLDTLHALHADHALDASGVLLVRAADLVAGAVDARARFESHIASVLAPVEKQLPGLRAPVVASLAPAVAHPLALRMHHLRCAAARDHAARALRTWLADAMAPAPEDELAVHDSLVPPELSPEPSRAARTVVEARLAANAFLLDWLVPIDPSRGRVDAFVRDVLVLYHRVRGIQAYVHARSVLASEAGNSPTKYDGLVWGGAA